MFNKRDVANSNPLLKLFLLEIFLGEELGYLYMVVVYIKSSSCSFLTSPYFIYMFYHKKVFSYRHVISIFLYHHIKLLF